MNQTRLIGRVKFAAKTFSHAICKMSAVTLLGLTGMAHAQIEGLPEIGELIWEDNFDTLNTEIWGIEEGDGCQYGVHICGWGNFELQWYSQDNISIQPVPDEEGNSALVIEARRETVNDSSFTSGRLKTENKISFKYGVIETRMRVPNLDTGLWPAAWFLGTSSTTWPQRGEIDLMEMGHMAEERARQGHEGADPNSYVGSNLIFFSSDACSEENPTCAASIAWDVNYNKPYVAETPMSDRFVTYRLYWTDTLMAFTIIDNDVETMLYEGPFPVTDETDAFRAPFYMLLNMAVGGGFTDAPTPDAVTAPLPASMYVDYVRVYQADGQGEVILGDISNAESGAFGVYTETTPVEGGITVGLDADFYLWDFGYTDGTTAPYEGDWAINIMYETAPPAGWFGSGVAAYTPPNMINYGNGELRFKIKIDPDVSFRIGIIDIYDNQNWAVFPANETAFGLERNGEWGEAVVPISLLRGTNVALQSMNYMFAITSNPDNPPTGALEYAIDDIVWYDTSTGTDSDGDGVNDSLDQCPDTPAGVVVDEAGCEIIPVEPETGPFGVYTETTPVSDGLQLGLNADLYFWDSGFVGGSTPAYEGDWAINIAYENTPPWFGNGIAAWNAPDMSNYGDGELQFWIKVPADLSFQVGIIDTYGNENWVKFPANQTTFGLERNGDWAKASVPISVLRGTTIALQSMNYMFAILFDPENPPAGPFELAIDDIVWVEVPDTDGDGIRDEDDHCADTTAGVTVDEVGCEVSLVSGVQSGTITLSEGRGHRWTKVAFDQPFNEVPVVVIGGPSANGESATTVKVRKVTTDGFEAQLDQWHWGRGSRGAREDETVTYIAAEPGVHQWGDMQVVAGEVDVSEGWVEEAFEAGFASTPVVFTQHVSERSRWASTTRVQNVSGLGFETTVQYAERVENFIDRIQAFKEKHKDKKKFSKFSKLSKFKEKMKKKHHHHRAESIQYIAVTANVTGEVGGVSVQSGTADVTDAWTPISFTGDLTEATGFMAGMQTTNEADTATVRYQSLSAEGVEVMIEEETSADGEVTHETETVGYLVLSPAASE